MAAEVQNHRELVSVSLTFISLFLSRSLFLSILPFPGFMCQRQLVLKVLPVLASKDIREIIYRASSFLLFTFPLSLCLSVCLSVCLSLSLWVFRFLCHSCLDLLNILNLDLSLILFGHLIRSCPQGNYPETQFGYDTTQNYSLLQQLFSWNIQCAKLS